MDIRRQVGRNRPFCRVGQPIAHNSQKMPIVRVAVIKTESLDRREIIACQKRLKQDRLKPSVIADDVFALFSLHKRIGNHSLANRETKPKSRESSCGLEEVGKECGGVLPNVPNLCQKTMRSRRHSRAPSSERPAVRASHHRNREPVLSGPTLGVSARPRWLYPGDRGRARSSRGLRVGRYA